MTYARYAVYDDLTGRILKIIKGNPNNAALNTGSGESYIEVAGEINQADHKIDILPDPVVAEPKAIQTLTVSKISIQDDLIDDAMISGIAAGSKISIIGVYEDQVIDGTQINFVSDTVGSYNLIISHEDYLNTVVTIAVTATT